MDDLETTRYGSRLLEGRVVAVSGVGPGLGWRIAEAASLAGADVVLGARTESYLEEVATALRDKGGRVAISRCDVTRDEDCAALVATAEDEFGGLDSIVCNAAAHAPHGMTLENGDLDDWRPVFEVNVFGSLRTVKAAIPALKRRGGGTVVFVGSQIVRRVFAGRGPYASSKAALLTASHVLARELGPYRIRVNTVVPGRMWGPPLQKGLGRLAEERGTTYDEQLERMIKDCSLPALATDEECARAVIFLASDLSAAMTGQAIDTNAGETFH
jgi:NAD(P)-dependent dehydrogenase (short-subunit alcohol dehydrogenase family)